MLQLSHTVPISAQPSMNVAPDLTATLSCAKGRSNPVCVVAAIVYDLTRVASHKSQGL